MSTQDGTTDVRVLYVEDNQQTGPLVRDWLERHDERFSVTLAVTLSEGAERIDEGGFDVVVSDYRFPEGSGLDLLATLRERDRDVPFLLYSARADDGVREEALDAGAAAVVNKGDATQLGELAERILDITGSPARTDDDEPDETPGDDAAPSVDDPTDDPLEAFAVEVVHDLRGPLSLAYGHLDMIEDDDEHVAALREALADLEATVDDLPARAATYDEE